MDITIETYGDEIATRYETECIAAADDIRERQTAGVGMGGYLAQTDGERTDMGGPEYMTA